MSKPTVTSILIIVIMIVLIAVAGIFVVQSRPTRKIEEPLRDCKWVKIGRDAALCEIVLDTASGPLNCVAFDAYNGGGLTCNWSD